MILDGRLPIVPVTARPGLAGELIATTGVGALLGWLVNNWLNNRLVFLLMVAILGSGAGIWSLYRTWKNPA
jgi:F0F1-type ATP synthase assembly protein I